MRHDDAVGMDPGEAQHYRLDPLGRYELAGPEMWANYCDMLGENVTEPTNHWSPRTLRNITMRYLGLVGRTGLNTIDEARAQQMFERMEANDRDQMEQMLGRTLERAQLEVVAGIPEADDADWEEVD